MEKKTFTIVAEDYQEDQQTYHTLVGKLADKVIEWTDYLLFRKINKYL
ncbi:hypothetical protein Belba_2869 [Belliella baltica DSM 15883]|uniref:Uncharacterized protein n=1 Tax=Belliella baltica (strain DSM 15883 / CIP 108006 / LMG 21964 / BA134) TaxID=866536 RepID=I3Z833_BELBD|nr:hypothetical protein [Belliella baltica]AFL85401.1 hypothetical protein Belba_2869 [Belliella baltica DSM 15883]